MLERLNKGDSAENQGGWHLPQSGILLAAGDKVYLMEYSEDWSVTRSYLSEESLKSLDNQVA